MLPGMRSVCFFSYCLYWAVLPFMDTKKRGGKRQCTLWSVRWTGLLHFAHYSSFAFRVVELLNSASPRPNKIFISWNIQFSHGLGDAQNTFKRNHLTKISKGAEEDPHILPLSIFPISIQLLPNETKSLGEWSSHQINEMKKKKKKRT